MKIKLIIIILITAIQSQAQLWQFGAAYNIIYQEGQILESYNPGNFSGLVYSMKPIKEQTHSIGMSFFYYHPVLKLNDEFSGGFQLGASIGGSFQKEGEIQSGGGTIGYQSGSPLILFTNIPLVGMFRFGNLSTTESKKLLGGAIGFGSTLTSYITPIENGTYLPLIITAELNYKIFGVRIDFPLNTKASYYKSNTGDIPKLSTSLFNLNLTFALNQE
jgi:hypothetical protein